MDIFEILPLLIFAAIYLFGSSKKREEEKRKKEMKRNPSVADTGTTGTKKLGLQERLEQALQQMEQRIEAESAGGRGPTRVEEPEGIASDELWIGPDRSAEERDPDSVSNDIGRMTASTLYEGSPYADSLLDSSPKDSNLLDGGVVKAPGHSGFNVRLDEGRSEKKKSQFDFKSLFEEVPNETYHGHGFLTFNEAHGMHYVAGTDPLVGETSRPEEFHDSGRIARKGTQVVQGESVRSIFRSPADLRRAIVLAEILDRPVSQRGGTRRGR